MTQARSLFTRGAVVILFLSAACAGSPQPVAEAERAQVLAFARPQTDNLMEGYNSGDYSIASRDFDDAMRKAMPPAAFAATRASLMGHLGKYISGEPADVFRQGDFYVVLYKAQFEQDPAVTMRVVFDQSGAHKVSGWWLDSPKLRQQ